MLNKVKEEFIRLFGEQSQVRYFFSPGRVNIIGEHIDYNGGYVLPCAIHLGTYFAICKNQTTKKDDMACEMIVAKAAPCTPIEKTKIKIGSKIQFKIAPIKTESILIFVNPCAEIKAFIPNAIITKIVPIA